MINVKKNNIIVREYNSKDFPAFYKRLCKNSKWTDTFSVWDLKEREASEFFALHLDQYENIDLIGKGLILGIFSKNDALIGSCGFEYNDEDQVVEVFLGLELKSRGKGYGREIVSAMCDICDQLKAKNIYANIPEEHIIAIKVFENSRFQYKNTTEYVDGDFRIRMRHYLLNN